MLTRDSVNMNTGYIGRYQLLGDSQLVRFCVEILDIKATLDEKRRSQVGFCISGQDSTELAKLVAENLNLLDDNLIIMIGTNDIKKDVYRKNFIESIESIKLTLEWKNIIWLTIPPIPKFMDSERYMERLRLFNNDIQRLQCDNIRVLDAYNLFINKDDHVMTHCFEEYFFAKKPPYRRDDIHLNRQGLIRLCTWICFHLLPEEVDVIKNYRNRKGNDVHRRLYSEFVYLSHLNLTPNSRMMTNDQLYFYITGREKRYIRR